jgi:hypothetical protein
MNGLSDHTTRSFILSSTAMLPTTSRVAARRYLLSRLDRGRARRADLLIIGHPKSGNTWLRTMVSRLYQVRHDLPPNLIVKSDELVLHAPAALRLLATNGYYSYEDVVGRMLDADRSESELRHKKVAFLVRHPCDIAVSWYFQFTKRQSAAKRELINHFIPHPIDYTSISMWDFVMHSDLGLHSLIDYLNTWERNVARIEQAITIRYEELRTDPARAMRQLVDLIGESFTDDDIREAVTFGSFDNLRKLEAAGFFRRGGLSRRDPTDQETFKVRRGKIAGYRDYFTAAQLAEMEALVDTRLSPTLGYGSTTDAPGTQAAAPSSRGQVGSPARDQTHSDSLSRRDRPAPA